MQPSTRWNAVVKSARRGVGAAVCCGAMMSSTPARAADPPPSLDMQQILDMEQRASTANPKEQAFLYADLADKMTVLASRQIAEGEIEKAEATLERMEAATTKMEGGLKESKSLKKTELLLHLTNRRLTDMARAASYDVKPHVQAALKRLNLAQTSLLAVIFAK